MPLYSDRQQGLRAELDLHLWIDVASQRVIPVKKLMREFGSEFLLADFEHQQVFRASGQIAVLGEFREVGKEYGL